MAPQDVHDQNRLTRDGEPTFERAVAALGILREAGLKPSISCTVTDASLEQWDRVQSLIIDDLKLHGLGFNILLPGPCGESSLRYSGRLDPTSALLQAYDRFRSLGIYEDRVMRRVKPFVNRRFHFKDCLGVGGQIAVAPDGSVGPCQGMLGNADYFPLNVSRDFDTSPYENPLFDEWTKRFPLKFEECVWSARPSPCVAAVVRSPPCAKRARSGRSTAGSASRSSRSTSGSCGTCTRTTSRSWKKRQLPLDRNERPIIDGEPQPGFE